MRKKLFSLATYFCLGLSTTTQAQNAGAAMCDVSIHSQQYKALPQEVLDEQQANEEFTRRHIQAIHMAKSTAVDTYRVALVFHVYGTVHNGKTVSDTLIQSAVAKLNQDFHGLNNDYNQVHQQFMSIRSPKNIKFYLAKKDPDGNNTTGIIYHPVQSGFANSTGYNTQIAADAWDNRKYINIYVQNDLFNNQVYNNSGYAYYPNTSMTNSNLARIVYNGAYIGSNTDPEFASTMTHEFGHFFNLIHTFDGGCIAPNDHINDTPPCTTGQGCHPTTTAQFPMNCNNQLVNADNYMDYNICYKMFTQQQADRMDAALQLPSRITLWQDSTLIATGIYTPNGVLAVEEEDNFSISPNPSNGIFTIHTGNTSAYQVEITNTIGQTIYKNMATTKDITIDLANQPKGIYFVAVVSDGRRYCSKMVIQ